MTSREILIEVRQRLDATGYSGLYNSNGRCGCGIEQLAPCGERQRDAGEAYINGCRPGYKHLDPREGHARYGDYVITDSKEPPEDDEFDNFYD